MVSESETAFYGLNPVIVYEEIALKPLTSPRQTPRSEINQEYLRRNKHLKQITRRPQMLTTMKSQPWVLLIQRAPIDVTNDPYRRLAETIHALNAKTVLTLPRDKKCYSTGTLKISGSTDNCDRCSQIITNIH